MVESTVERVGREGGEEIRGDHYQGVSAITVYVGDGWSKRSHKHSYNANSGVAIIIGKTKLARYSTLGYTINIAVHALKRDPTREVYLL